MKPAKQRRQGNGKTLFPGLLRIFLALALVLVVFSPAVFHPAQTAENALPLQDVMPGFKLARPRVPAPSTPFQDAAGSTVTLADFKGNALLVNFWASWCAPCITEMPGLARLQQAMAGEKFIVLAVSLDREAATAQRFMAEKLRLTDPAVYHDPRMKLSRALGAAGLPASFLLDDNGNIVGRYDGPAEWDGEAAKALIRALLREAE